MVTSPDVVSGPDAKRALRAPGPMAVEMEGLAVARACAEHGVAFAALRVVLDPVDSFLPDLGPALDPDGRPRARAMLRRIASDPSLVPHLVRVHRQARVAHAALARAVVAVAGGP